MKYICYTNCLAGIDNGVLGWGGERGLWFIRCEGLWFTRWEVYQWYFSELNVTHLTCPPNDCTFYLNDIDFGKWLPFDNF